MQYSNKRGHTKAKKCDICKKLTASRRIIAFFPEDFLYSFLWFNLYTFASCRPSTANIQVTFKVTFTSLYEQWRRHTKCEKNCGSLLSKFYLIWNMNDLFASQTQNMLILRKELIIPQYMQMDNTNNILSNTKSLGGV